MTYYIVRSGRNWDNPKIEFITTDFSIVEAVLERDRWNHYNSNYVQSEQWRHDHSKERIEFYEYKLTKGPLDEFDKTQYEMEKETFEGLKPILSYEDWKKEVAWGTKGKTNGEINHDWFYDVLDDSIDDVTEAISYYISKAYNDYGEVPS